MAIHLHIPGVTGSATDVNHTNWLEVAELDWGVTRRINANPSTSKDRESTDAEMSDVSCVRYMDRASPELFLASCCGKGKTISFRLTSTGAGRGASHYLEYVLENAIISSYHVVALSHAKRRPLEMIVISATKIQLRYTPHDDNGYPISPLTSAFDFQTNTVS